MLCHWKFSLYESAGKTTPVSCRELDFTTCSWAHKSSEESLSQCNYSLSQWPLPHWLTSANENMLDSEFLSVFLLLWFSTWLCMM
jgi:hypothetical protein